MEAEVEEEEEEEEVEVVLFSAVLVEAEEAAIKEEIPLLPGLVS